MKLHWHTVTKSPYPYELGSLYLYVGDAIDKDDCAAIACIRKEHPHKWNREEVKNDINFDVVEFIVTVYDLNATIKCKSFEEAQREVKRLLYDYTNLLHRFCQDEVIPTI